MNKVYCKNCKWHRWPFLEDDYCRHPRNREERFLEDYEEKFKYTSYIKKPWALNKNNDCKYYKRKWWKFLVED